MIDTNITITTLPPSMRTSIRPLRPMPSEAHQVLPDRKMVQNLAWATGYNAVALPLAAGVLASDGIVLSPAIGAVLMSLSTLIVAINARILKVSR